jgi:hypothetical protein
MLSNAFSHTMGAAAAGLAMLLTTGAALAEGPNYALPALIEADASSGFVPFTVDVTAGGDQQIPFGVGTGWVAAAPDFRLDMLTSSTGLSFSLTPASDDMVLLVNDPSGNWYYSADVVPAINIPLAGPGQYDVWAGTLGGGYPSATLHVAEY